MSASGPSTTTVATSTDTPTPDTLALLIHQLTTPTSTNIRTAESNILSYLTDPRVIDPLSLLLSHSVPQIRHLSAVLLRNALTRHAEAPSFPGLLETTKARVLPLLSTEVDVAARRGLIAVATLICKQQQAIWPELTSTAMQLTQAQNSTLRASAYSVFQALCETNADDTLVHLDPISKLISKGLADGMPNVRLAALRAYSATVSVAFIRQDISLTPLINLLPAVGGVLTTTHNQDRMSDNFARVASTVFDVSATVLEIIPHHPGSGSNSDNLQNPNQSPSAHYFVQFCKLALHIFSDEASCRQARSAATEFLVFAISIKPLSLRAEGLALNILHAACNVVTSDPVRAAAPPDSADSDVDDGDYEPVNLALRLLYSMTKRTELSRLTFTHVMAVANQALKHSSAIHSSPSRTGDSTAPNMSIKPYASAYRMIGTISEGTTYDLTLHVREIVPLLVAGAYDDSNGFATRGRALEALAYVCEALETDELADDIIAQVSNSALDAVLAGLHHSESYVCKQACIALEPVLNMFANESDGLKARFNDILRALGAVGNTGKIAEEAVMAIGVLAENAPEAFVQSDLYGDVVQWILRVMASTNTSTASDEDNKYLVRSAAVNAAGVLLAHCKDHSIIETLANHAIAGLDSDEPQLKQATFSFFAKMTDVVGASVVTVFGTRILKAAVESIQRETVSYGADDDDDNDEEGSTIDPRLFDVTAKSKGGDKLDGIIGGSEDDEEKTSFEVHSAYLDEKMVAVIVTGSLATACGTTDYIERITTGDAGMKALALEVKTLLTQCVALIEELTRYYQDDVRTSAYLSLCRLAVANVEIKRRQPALAFCERDLVRDMFPLLDSAVELEDDIHVMTNVISWYASFFRHISPEVLMEKSSIVIKVLKSLLKRQTLSQMRLECDYTDESGVVVNEEGGGEVNDDDVGDADGDLMESVGEVIVAMSWSLRGYFASDFAQLLTIMMEGLDGPGQSTKKETMSSIRLRGTVLGTIAAVLLYLNWERCDKLPTGVPQEGSAQYELALRTCDEIGAQLLPTAAEAVQSESKTVRQNGMFLVGVIFAYCRKSNKRVWDLLPQTLKGLEEIISGEKTFVGGVVDPDTRPNEDGRTASVTDDRKATGHGALVDNAAGALSRIMCSNGISEDVLQGQLRGMIHAVLRCVPVRNDVSENTSIAKAVMLTSVRDFDALIATVDIGRKTVLCLVTAVIAFANWQYKQQASGGSWIADVDICDEICWLTQQDAANMVRVLKRVSDVIGQAEVSKLRIKRSHQTIISDMIASLPPS